MTFSYNCKIFVVAKDARGRSTGSYGREQGRVRGWWLDFRNHIRKCARASEEDKGQKCK